MSERNTGDRDGMEWLWSPENRLFELARQAKRPTRWWIIPPLLLAFTLAGIGGVAFTVEEAAESGLWNSALQTVGFLTLTYLPVIVPISIWITKRERRPFRTIGLNPRGAIEKFGLGFVFGFILMSVGAATAIMFGADVDPGRAEAVGLEAIAPALVVLVGWAIQGTVEEMMFRGWLLQATGVQLAPVAGIAFSTLAFAVAHAANPGINSYAVINLFLIGVLFALVALFEGGLWAVSGLHVAWNWAQSNVYGFEVSGLTIGGGSIVRIDPSGSTALTGGDFGFEGSAVATAVIFAGIFLILACAERFRPRTT